MKIIAQICMFNEVEKGNLERCLNNCRQWADDIVIYDDGSTDDSVEVAQRYTPHIIIGGTNNVMEEQQHKQQILDYSLSLGPDWLMWIDCDEILDRRGTAGGLRELAAAAPPSFDAYAFHEVNLWRSQTYARVDSFFDTPPGTPWNYWTYGWFTRLWRVVPGIRLSVATEVHGRLYPITINTIGQAPIEVIHYGYWDYLKMMVKVGVHLMDREQLWAQARVPGSYIINEEHCACRRVPNDVFPPENVPPDIWPEPTGKPVEDLIPYAELIQAMAGAR